MPGSLDLFRNDAFSLRQLTAAVNNMPVVPGKLGQLGIFREFGVTTPNIMIEEKNGVLSLVPTKPRGGEKNQNKSGGRKLRALRIPHLPIEDRIMADEIVGVRQFGTEDQLATVQGTVNDKLAEMTVKLDATVEHLRIGAVKGQILDADGSVIYDLFDEFGVTQAAEIDFDLDNANPASGALKKKCNSVIRATEIALGNAVIYDHIHAYASPEFMDDFTSHPEVVESYKRQESQFLREGQVKRAFVWGDIVWEEYNGAVGDRRFIAQDKVHFFPVGAPGLFEQPNAPAAFVETVNTIGLPRYAKIAPDDKYDEYVDVFLQANTLPYCTKPKTLMKGKRT